MSISRPLPPHPSLREFTSGSGDIVEPMSRVFSFDVEGNDELRREQSPFT
jgi:hypothetical protein